MGIVATTRRASGSRLFTTRRERRPAPLPAHDGSSSITAAMVHTLAAAGIVAICTAKTEHAAVLANGNQNADKGAYVRADGTEGDLVEVTGDLADIDLADNPFYSEFTDTVALTVEAQALPAMQGSGAVRDLREAANDATFKMRGMG